MTSSVASTGLASLAGRYWRFVCHEQPLTAILAGEATQDAVVFRESGADYERRYRLAAEMLDALGAIAPDGLAPDDRATHALLAHELRGIRTLHEVGAHRRPSLFPNGPALMTSHFANTTAVSDAASAELYVDRLATVPAYLRDLEGNLRAGHRDGIRYPRLVLDLAVAAVRGAFAGPAEASPLLGPFARSAAAGRDSVRAVAERTRALIAAELAPAFEAFARFLEGPLAEGARDTIACTDAPGGREFYRAVVRNFVTTDASPEEIHGLGLSEVERLAKEIEAVAAEAGYPNNLDGYRRLLAGDAFFAPSKEALRERIEALSKRIDRRIPAFFGRIPRITYGVETMPEAMSERMPPAYAQPSPADRSEAGIHWVTALPTRFPIYLQPAVALHEAWPGHLMHLALIQEADGLPAFRRHGGLRFSVCIEGWAVYCEGLGEEMGVYRTPHERYGRLESEMWRALRLVVDTGIHWAGWDRERAIEAMAARMALPRPTIAAEVDRYIAWPGQALVYQIGNLEIRALRQRAERELGERFSHRAFHDAVTGAGPVTMPVLRLLVGDWLDRRTGRRSESEVSDARA